MWEEPAILRDNADAAVLSRHGAGAVGQWLPAQRDAPTIGYIETRDDAVSRASIQICNATTCYRGEFADGPSPAA